MKLANMALAGLAAVSAGAWAQNVVLYGVADAGVVGERGCIRNCGTATRVESGIAGESFLGLRGNEPLGNQWQAVFGLEAGFRLDTGQSQQNGKLFNRQAYVGLQHDTVAVLLGRQYTLDYQTLVDVGDPFKGGLAGTATNLVGYSGKRMDNAIRVQNQSRSGLFTAATYGFGEASGDWHANRVWGVSVGLTRGAFTVRAAHQNLNVTDTTMVMPVRSYDARHSILAANLDLGPATVYTAFAVNKGSGDLTLWNPDNPFSAAVSSTPSTDSRDLLLGIAIPRGATTFLASYIRKNDRDPSDRDADQVALGVTYALSKRTDMYAAVSRISNKHGAAYTVGNASDPGRSTKAINFGLRHAF
ncbi:MAG TPA: porin [Telluria sp.]|nr:porin [Telluria sp.]